MKLFESHRKIGIFSSSGVKNRVSSRLVKFVSGRSQSVTYSSKSSKSSKNIEIQKRQHIIYTSHSCISFMRLLSKNSSLKFIKLE